MTQADYAEAWAWVHFLLHSRPDHALLLQQYVADLRGDAAPPPVSLRLTQTLRDPEASLVEHVRYLAANVRGL